MVIFEPSTSLGHLHTFPTRRSSDLFANMADELRAKQQRRQEMQAAAAIQQSILPAPLPEDRKSTRLNSSHLGISYAVFCLKKKSDKAQEHIDKRHSPGILVHRLQKR